MNRVESEGNIVELAKTALEDELSVVKIYSTAARIARERSTKDKLLEICEMEKGHADFWKQFLRRRGIDPSLVRVSSLKATLYAIFLKSIRVSSNL